MTKPVLDSVPLPLSPLVSIPGSRIYTYFSTRTSTLSFLAETGINTKLANCQIFREARFAFPWLSMSPCSNYL